MILIKSVFLLARDEVHGTPHQGEVHVNRICLNKNIKVSSLTILKYFTLISIF